VILIGAGRFASPGIVTKAGLVFRGIGRPYLDDATTPTTLLGGTVITNQFTLRGIGLRAIDLGVDVGSVVIGAGAATDGLVVDDDLGGSITRDVILARVSALCKTESSAVHAMRVEGATVSDVTVVDAVTALGVHSMACKADHVRIRNLRGYKHGTDGLVIKAEIGQTVTNVTADEIVMLGLANDIPAVVIMGAGGTLNQCTVSRVYSSQTGLKIEGIGSIGTLVLRDIISQAGNGAILDVRTGTNVIDFIDIDGVEAGPASTACIRLGDSLTCSVNRANIARVKQLGNSTWGALLYGPGTFRMSECHWRNTVFIHPNMTAVKSPPASNTFLAGLNDGGSKYSETT
jgi:hypothetical protein